MDYSCPLSVWKSAQHLEGGLSAVAFGRVLTCVTSSILANAAKEGEE
jgi:hypothetical protein